MVSMVDGRCVDITDALYYKLHKDNVIFTGKNAKANASHVDHIHTNHILHKCLVCGTILKTSDALTRHIDHLLELEGC